MPYRASPLVAAGDGALAGLLAGAALGGWHLRLSEDPGHGMTWLAAERLLGPLAVCAAAGIAVSLAAGWLLSAAARGGARRLRLAAVSVLVLGDVALALLLLIATGLIGGGPLRQRLFPLIPHSSGKLAVAALGLAGACAAILLAVRALGALRASLPSALRTGGRPGPMRASLAGAALAAALAAAGARAALPLLATGRAAGHPPVILVSIDTMRADRMGALGADRPLTPRLDALASEGALFEQASATAPWTLPSHVSIFTSRLPFDHRVRWSRSRIHPSVPMLAERFRDAGYRTAAFTGGGYVAAPFGFDQGFDLYEDHDEAAEGGPEVIARAAAAWVGDGEGRPFFLFVHTYEPHAPYTRDEFAGPDPSGRLPRLFTAREVDELLQGRRTLSPEERERVIDLYDGGVAYADRVIGDLLEELRGRGVLDRAILVVLSDHGEDLWDHDASRSPHHGHSLYEEMIRVPLFFRAPGRVTAGLRVRTPVSLLDVAPTLLDLAGLAPDRTHAGRSLAKELARGEQPAGLPVLAESVEYGPDRFSRREGPLKAIVTPYPGIFNNGVALDVPPVELFDLSADPLEREDLSGGPRGLAAEGLVEAARERALRFVRPDRPGERAPEGGAPAELIEQLRTLGYTD